MLITSYILFCFINQILSHQFHKINTFYQKTFDKGVENSRQIFSQKCTFAKFLCSFRFHKLIKSSSSYPAHEHRLIKRDFFCLYNCTAAFTSSLSTAGGLPKRTPLALAASMPSFCRCRMFSRSFSAA